MTSCHLFSPPNSPVSDPEHSCADHHWLQFVERGEVPMFGSIFWRPSCRTLNDAALFYLAVLPSCLGRVVGSAGVLRTRYGRADQLDQVGPQILLCYLQLDIREILAVYVPSSFRSQAPVATVFAGSPQLLGTVKLGSGSAITTLPLYSDIDLLRSTEDVSDMKDSVQ